MPGRWVMLIAAGHKPRPTYGTPQVARRLPAAPTPARLAYIGRDGSPRLIPMNFVWTGDELVMGAFAGTYKIADLQAHPDVAV